MANSARSSSKSGMGRNRRIARDLEILPNELIEEIIKELEIERTIRLSIWAGPQLTNALAASPTWRHLFGSETDRQTWQKFLRITDRMNKLCFDTRCEHRPIFSATRPSYIGNGSDRFRFGIDLSFLRDRGLHTSTLRSFVNDPQLAAPPDLFLDARSMEHRWLEELNAQMQRTTARLSPTRLQEFKVHLPAKETRDRFTATISTLNLDSSVDELDFIVTTHLEAFTNRAKSLANELHRLALLYEAHPQLLKQPFAPQTPRPNTKHVPEQLRHRARKLEASSSVWLEHDECPSFFRDDFPGLVPYNWVLQLFVAMVKQGKIEIDQKCQFIMDGMARYYPREGQPPEESGQLPAFRTVGTPWSIGDAKGTKSKILTQRKKLSMTYTAHANIELEWLETFVEVMAQLVERFPLAAEAAKSADSVWSEVLTKDFTDKLFVR